MRIVENNAPVKREKCWNCNSILELNLTDDGEKADLKYFNR